MKNSLFEQAANVLRSRSNRTRWLSVTLCLALMVSAGTFYAFMRQGQARVRTEKLLICQFVPHEHEDSCFGTDEDGNIDESIILCGMADYVLHSHTDDCRDENGRMICELPEIEEHQHDSSCYSYHEYLVCDHEPDEAGHQHTDECYEERVIEDEGDNEPEEPTDACTQEEHIHSDECYTKTETAGERVLTCSASEHTHDDSCYTETSSETLTCSASEHSHSDSCYTPIYSEELTCSDSSEEHSHDSGCYSSVETGSELTCGESEHSHDGGCYTTETTRELTCSESEHTHDDSCYSESSGETVEELTCGKTEHTHDENCSGSVAAPSEPKTERVLICGQEEVNPEAVHTSDCYETEEELTCDKEEIVAHIHDDSCYDEDDNLVCGKLETQEHIHGPECFIEVTVGVDDPKYVCGKTYHVHEDGCYSEDGELLCPLEEHEHGDDCLDVSQEQWICGMTAHKHDESCYNDALELVCGLEEHEHSDKCLPEPEWLCGKMEHTHDDSCYDANGELVCPLEEHQHTGLCMNPVLQPEPEWKCGKIAHTHGADCYDENNNLICELKEHEHTNLCLKSEDEVSWLCGKTAHTHDESCYDEDGVLVCGLEEHEHTYDCLKDHAIEWLCGKTEHKHGADCYDENGVLVCALEEHSHSVFCLMDEIKDEDCICGKVAHIHDESCRDENGELICGLEEHIHTAECLPAEIKWLCGKVEHQHDESCYDENGALICGLEEHTHTAACLVEQDGRWLCGKIEHTHGPECYDENGELVCELEEHTHTEDCLLLPETVMVAQEHNYTTASGLFDITFRVEGPAILRLDPSAMPETPDETPVPDESPDSDGVNSPDENNDAPEAAPVDENVPASEDENAPAPAPEDTSPADDSDGDQPEEPAEVERDFRFQIDELEAVKDVNAEALEALTLFTQKAEEQDENLLEALSVYLYCDGERLDLSDCKVTAEIKPTELLRQMVAEMEANTALAIEDPEADPDAEPAEPQETPALALRLTAVEAAENEEIKELDTIYITSDDAGSVPVASETETEDVDASVDADASDGEQSQVPVTDEPEKTELKTMMVTMQTSDIAVYGANGINDRFKVQYYAYIDRLVTSKNKDDIAVGIGKEPEKYTLGEYTDKVPMYDTEAHGLPQNSVSSHENQQIFFYANSSGGVYKEKEVLTELFAPITPRFFTNPGFTYIDILPEESPSDPNHYALKEVWILKEGEEDSSKVKSDWIVYGNGTGYDEEHQLSTLKFTNRKETAEADRTYIWVTESTVIRMVYDATDGVYDNKASFYDYDITDGKVYTSLEDAKSQKNGKPTSTQAELESKGVTLYAFTEKQGINDDGNYTGSNSKLAFGNNNVKTGLGDQSVSKNGDLYYINHANARDEAANKNNLKSILDKCSFGIVSNSLTGGELTYANGIQAPKLFNEKLEDGEVVKGKKTFLGGLSFIRNGDTYTLTAVTGSNSQASGLENFVQAGTDAYGTKYKMYTNEFWPMDRTIEETKSSTWGTDGHDMKFGDETKDSRQSVGKVDSCTMPKNDNPGKGDHNSYFGMHFTVNFKLSADYLGPLEYIFYGDDDMWVYLVGSGKDKNGNDETKNDLICDIGGVHQSIGEYVNLRQNLPNGSSGEYTLHFFYLERGASGSTCWMQFTLPQASSGVENQPDAELTNTLHVSKEVAGEVDPNQEFEFELRLYDKDGTSAPHNYSYTRYDVDRKPIGKGVIADRGHFFLKHKEFIEFDYLPPGGRYEIIELGAKTAETYSLESRSEGVSVNGTAASGDLNEGSNSGTINVELVNRELVKMPETGGNGTTTFSVLGAGLLLGGMLIVLRRKREE